MSEHHRKLERMYLSAKVNNDIYDTTTCEINDEKAEIGLSVDPKYFHALNAIHGSVYFKLLDDAAYFAVNSIVTDVYVLTTSFNIHITRPVSEGRLKAVGVIKHKSRKSFVAEATLYNEQGKVVAFGTGNFVKSKVELTTEIGYV